MMILIIFTKNLNIDKKLYEKGVKIITISDLRWLRRDIKTTSLLPNVLSKQLAVEKNAFESWLIDDGNITEGSASNAWIIKNSKTVVTHPVNNKILKGVTRDTIIKILKKNGFNIKEKAFNLIEAKNAKEAFLTSSTLSVLPVVKIDNYNISNGKPGDITKKIDVNNVVKKIIKNHFLDLEKNQRKFVPGKSKIPLAFPPYGANEVYEALDSMMKLKTTMGDKVRKFEKELSPTRSKKNLLLSLITPLIILKFIIVAVCA